MGQIDDRKYELNGRRSFEYSEGDEEEFSHEETELEQEYDNQQTRIKEE